MTHIHVLCKLKFCIHRNSFVTHSCLLLDKIIVCYFHEKYYFQCCLHIYLIMESAMILWTALLNESNAMFIPNLLYENQTSNWENTTKWCNTQLMRKTTDLLPICLLLIGWLMPIYRTLKKKFPNCVHYFKKHG